MGRTVLDSLETIEFIGSPWTYTILKRVKEHGPSTAKQVAGYDDFKAYVHSRGPKDKADAVLPSDMERLVDMSLLGRTSDVEIYETLYAISDLGRQLLRIYEQVEESLKK